MSKKPEVRATPIVDPDLDRKLSQLVGNIVEPPPAVTVPPAFHQPSAAEMAAFAPPPPIAGASVFPQAPPGMVFGDRSTHSGVTVGTLVEAPVVVTPAEVPPPPAAKFEDLPKKTRTELMASYLLKHDTLEGFEYIPRDDVHVPRSNITIDPTAVEQEPEVDMSKLSPRTRAELEMGKKKLAQRNSDYRDVLAKVARDETQKAAAEAASVAG